MQDFHLDADRLLEDEEKRERGSRSLLGLVAGIVSIVVAALAGTYLVFVFVAGERDRDLRAWQTRLGIVADSRVAALDDWLRNRRAVLQDLAENASLQLYVSALLDSASASAEDREAAEAQGEYLRNLLVATADKGGYKGEVLGPDVAANVKRTGVGGIALATLSGRLLVSTPFMPPMSAPIRQALAGREPGQTALIDMHLSADNRPRIGFIVPAFSVQADETPGGEAAVIIGLLPLGEDFFANLRQPGETAETAESYLVRRDGKTVLYLSPLRDGSKPLTRRMALDTPDLAAAWALENPGGFTRAVNYRNADVLVTARALSVVPWTLLRTIDADEALAETDRRARFMVLTLLGVIVLFLLLLLLAWRHGTSVRARSAAQRYKRLARRLGELTDFLRIVTDGQPTAIAAFDADNHYRFANRVAAREADATPDEILGKSLKAVLGPVRARPIEQLNRRALDLDEAVSDTLSIEDGGRVRIVKSDHIPLDLGPGLAKGVLVVQEDVTEVVEERARRERVLRQLVTTVVAVVDRRDPWAAHHSARVAEVARAIAEEMGLDKVLVETAETAGAVMGLGKSLVPESLLVKRDKLSKEELRQIRESILTSADLLEGVEFDGPVVETLRQIQEHWDGSGIPKGLKGKEILITARIVAVANAFVGMVSARAYRPGMSFDEVSHHLMEEAGRRFDQAPVTALLNILDNRGGRERWAHYQEPVEGLG